jgi:hypothetical protein
MERRAASGMATQHPQVTRRSLVKGTGFGSVAAVWSPPLRQNFIKEIDDR